MIEQELRGALAALVDGLPARKATAAVDRLISSYRGRTPTETPVLRERADVVAYAAYRMPATFGAASAALEALARRADGWSPRSHLDLGGGTGAAVWAAAGVWPDTPRTTRVLDWSPPALALGRELAEASSSDALRETRWDRQALAALAAAPGGARLDQPEGAHPEAGEGQRPPEGAEGAADLVTVSYVLGELDERDRHSVVESAVQAARHAVVLVEPGTPEGYLRVRAAREQLVGAGLRVLAPCPHSERCPIVPGEDWCHFAARISRSSLHRRVKGGALPYEDEKFSYVVAVRDAGAPASARIVRHPQTRKGQVLLDLCTAEGELRRTTVTKRHGTDYRAARNASWGDPWPPNDDHGRPAR